LVKTFFKIISDIEIHKHGEQTELETRLVHAVTAGYCVEKL